MRPHVSGMEYDIYVVLDTKSRKLVFKETFLDDLRRARAAAAHKGGNAAVFKLAKLDDDE